MKRFIFLFVPVLLAWPAQAEWQYPPTKTVDASDTYFGKTYKDPYRVQSSGGIDGWPAREDPWKG